MNHTAIALKDLSASDLAFVAINQAGYNLKKHTLKDITFLTEEKFPPCIPVPCSRMNISEMWSCKGVVIATNLTTANTLAKAVIPAKKVFYVWDLEFLRGNKNFKENVEIYRNPSLTLICRSQSHAEALENYCNRKPDCIIPDLNIEEIERWVKEKH